VTGAIAAMIRDRAAGDLIHPRSKALLILKTAKPAVHAQEDLLDDVVDISRGDPLRDERSKPLDEVGMAGSEVGRDQAFASVVQHSGPQHEPAERGLRA
jgi:hypothetical protein